MPSDSSPPPLFPRRYIYNDVDMQYFLQSDAKSELLRVTAAMGKSCSSSQVNYEYDPNSPLVGLSPAVASLHGSLRGMLLWLDDFPPTDRSKARFGNPAFRQWHTQRLVQRSVAIIRNVISTYEKYSADEPNKEYDLPVLQKISEEGYQCAVDQSTVIDLDSISNDKTRLIVTELCAYLCAAFGHEIRIDYGTGHECSFQVLLYSLCKLGCFGSTPDQPPSETRLKAITISIYFAYLNVTRQIQMEYMLEPAGSHGVWGLDDYHCLPFYFGACQLQAVAESSSSSEQQQQQDDNEELQSPSSIHNDSILQRYGDKYLFYGCIRYIKTLKRGVPFFESSPMLNDISHSLPTWSKVASGLLRLFEGEVLKKRQVVQHFVFGNVFKASWTPSEGEERSLPSTTFRVAASASPPTPPPHPTPAAVGPMARAPWNEDTGNPPSSPVSPSRAKCDTAAVGLMVGTRAPWAATTTDNGNESGGGGGNSANLPPPTKAPWAK